MVYEFPNIAQVGADKVDWVARGPETFWSLKPQTKWLTLGNARIREDIFTNKEMITVNHIVAQGRCVLQQADDGVVSDAGVKAAGERFMASLKLF